MAPEPEVAFVRRGTAFEKQYQEAMEIYNTSRRTSYHISFNASCA